MQKLQFFKNTDTSRIFSYDAKLSVQYLRAVVYLYNYSDNLVSIRIIFKYDYNT